jgi:hypothetical protein
MAELTPAIANSLMQQSMVSGVPTSTFNQYGGYNAVQAMYEAGGGKYAPTAATIAQYGPQVAQTGVGNFSYAVGPLSPTAQAALANMSAATGQDLSSRVGQSAGSPLAKMTQVVAGSPTSQSSADIVTQIFREQLGRLPEKAALDHYVAKLAAGKSPDQIAQEIDRSTEGYNYDVQNVTSAYRQNFGRDPDQAGVQYWLGREDNELNLSQKLSDYIRGGAGGVDVEAIARNPTGYLSMISEALRADPYAGMYAVQNPYYFSDQELATVRDQPNVSRTAAGQYIQYVSPVTQQPMVSGYTPDGQYKVVAGNHTLQADRVRQAVDLGQKSGALSKTDADRILNAISSPDTFRNITGTTDPKANTLYALLSDPKANVMVNALGIQVGEDANAQLAMDEVAARQRIVDKASERVGGNVNPSTITQEQVAKELGILFPFTEDNMSIDPLTGQKIRTKMTPEDVVDNLFTQLKIPIDTRLRNVFTEGLNYSPEGVAPGGGAPKTPAAIIGSSGDFRGLPFPQARPTTISETPAMLGFQPYSIEQPGSGQAKTTEPQPVIPRVDTTVDPVTSGLLGAAIGAMLPGSQSNVESALSNIAQGVKEVINPSDMFKVNASAGTATIPSTYAKNGGLATPLMKEGGMVQNFADGGASQIASGIGDLFSSSPVRGALFGALISNLLNAQARAQEATAYRGVDMSKVGVIPPRTTQVGPVRFAPYRQYASAPEIPQTISSPINIGALTASQTPMTTFTPTTGMTNPLARPINTTVPRPTPLNTIMPTPMADGGAAYYTYGQHVDPMQYLQGMAHGGMARGGLNEVHHADNAPLVQGRKDYRAGSAVTGPGDGQSDDIPAMLADGEYVFDSDTVAQLGNGSTKAGSKILDKFREEIRQHKRSAPVNKIPPPSKSPLAYLAEAQKKMKGARRG